MSARGDRDGARGDRGRGQSSEDRHKAQLWDELQARLQGLWDQMPKHPADSHETTPTGHEYAAYDEARTDWLEDLCDVIEAQVPLERPGG